MRALCKKVHGVVVQDEVSAVGPAPQPEESTAVSSDVSDKPEISLPEV